MVRLPKIFHAAFLNCEYGSTLMLKDDMKFIESFVEETEKSFHIAMEGQTKQIVEMLKMHE